MPRPKKDPDSPKSTYRRKSKIKSPVRSEMVLSSKKDEIIHEEHKSLEVVKIGRRVPYDPVYCQSVLKLMSEGYSITEVIAELGVSKSTLYRWANEHKEFKEALQLGIEYAQAWWEKLGREFVVSEVRSPRKINLGLYVFVMKNRFGYRDVTKIESSISVDSKQGIMNEESNRAGEEISEEARAAKVIDILIRTGAIQSGTGEASETEAEPVHEN